MDYIQAYKSKWKVIYWSYFKRPRKRWLDGAGYNPNTKFGKAISKYGWENFSHEILEENIDNLKEAQEREKFWIKQLDTFKNGYNSTEGGDMVAPGIVPKRPVICHDTKEIFESTVAAAERYQVEHTNISRACKECVKFVESILFILMNILKIGSLGKMAEPMIQRK